VGMLAKIRRMHLRMGCPSERLAEIGPEDVLDPVADLRPVCPKCHAMLHRCTAVLVIDELKRRLER